MAEHMLCAVEGCGKGRYAKGRCRLHYYRVRRTGTTDAPDRGNGPAQTWLRDHCEHANDECLLWPFARGSHGYGVVDFDGQRMMASRAVCILAHGKPKDDHLHAAHTCGNGRNGCVNPKHLRWATASENHQDAIRHGTHRGLLNKGSLHPCAKLTENDVVEIRAMAKAGVRTVNIGDKFGVTSATVQGIIARRSWRHI